MMADENEDEYRKLKDEGEQGLQIRGNREDLRRNETLRRCRAVEEQLRRMKDEDKDRVCG